MMPAKERPDLAKYHRQHADLYPPGWEALERKTKAAQPWCSFCGSKEELQVHHVNPIHLHPELALNPGNLIVLCQPCHLREGHVGDFEHGFDTAVRQRAISNLAAVNAARAAEALSRLGGPAHA